MNDGTDSHDHSVRVEQSRGKTDFTASRQRNSYADDCEDEDSQSSDDDDGDDARSDEDESDSNEDENGDHTMANSEASVDGLTIITLTPPTPQSPSTVATNLASAMSLDSFDVSRMRSDLNRQFGNGGQYHDDSHEDSHDDGNGSEEEEEEDHPRTSSAHRYDSGPLSMSDLASGNSAHSNGQQPTSFNFVSMLPTPPSFHDPLSAIDPSDPQFSRPDTSTRVLSEEDAFEQMIDGKLFHGSKFQNEEEEDADIRGPFPNVSNHNEQLVFWWADDSGAVRKCMSGKTVRFPERIHLKPQEIPPGQYRPIAHHPVEALLSPQSPRSVDREKVPRSFVTTRGPRSGFGFKGSLPGSASSTDEDMSDEEQSPRFFSPSFLNSPTQHGGQHLAFNEAMPPFLSPPHSGSSSNNMFRPFSLSDSSRSSASVDSTIHIDDTQTSMPHSLSHSSQSIPPSIPPATFNGDVAGVGAGVGPIPFHFNTDANNLGDSGGVPNVPAGYIHEDEIGARIQQAIADAFANGVLQPGPAMRGPGNPMHEDTPFDFEPVASVAEMAVEEADDHIGLEEFEPMDMLVEEPLEHPKTDVTEDEKHGMFIHESAYLHSYMARVNTQHEAETRTNSALVSGLQEKVEQLQSKLNVASSAQEELEVAKSRMLELERHNQKLRGATDETSRSLETQVTELKRNVASKQSELQQLTTKHETEMKWRDKRMDNLQRQTESRDALSAALNKANAREKALRKAFANLDKIMDRDHAKSNANELRDALKDWAFEASNATVDSAAKDVCGNCDKMRASIASVEQLCISLFSNVTTCVPDSEQQVQTLRGYQQALDQSLMHIEQLHAQNLALQSQVEILSATTSQSTQGLQRPTKQQIGESSQNVKKIVERVGQFAQKTVAAIEGDMERQLRVLNERIGRLQKQTVQLRRSGIASSRSSSGSSSAAAAAAAEVLQAECDRLSSELAHEREHMDTMQRQFTSATHTQDQQLRTFELKIREEEKRFHEERKQKAALEHRVKALEEAAQLAVNLAASVTNHHTAITDDDEDGWGNLEVANQSKVSINHQLDLSAFDSDDRDVFSFINDDDNDIGDMKLPQQAITPPSNIYPPIVSPPTDGTKWSASSASMSHSSPPITVDDLHNRSPVAARVHNLNGTKEPHSGQSHSPINNSTNTEANQLLSSSYFKPHDYGHGPADASASVKGFSSADSMASVGSSGIGKSRMGHISFTSFLGLTNKVVEPSAPNAQLELSSSASSFTNSLLASAVAMKNANDDDDDPFANIDDDDDGDGGTTPAPVSANTAVSSTLKSDFSPTVENKARASVASPQPGHKANSPSSSHFGRLRPDAEAGLGHASKHSPAALNKPLPCAIDSPVAPQPAVVSSVNSANYVSPVMSDFSRLSQQFASAPRNAVEQATAMETQKQQPTTITRPIQKVHVPMNKPATAPSSNRAFAFGDDDDDDLADLELREGPRTPVVSKSPQAHLDSVDEKMRTKISMLSRSTIMDPSLHMSDSDLKFLDDPKQSDLSSDSSSDMESYLRVRMDGDVDTDKDSEFDLSQIGGSSRSVDDILSEIRFVSIFLQLMFQIRKICLCPLPFQDAHGRKLIHSSRPLICPYVVFCVFFLHFFFVSFFSFICNFFFAFISIILLLFLLIQFCIAFVYFCLVCLYLKRFHSSVIDSCFNFIFSIVVDLYFDRSRVLLICFKFIMILFINKPPCNKPPRSN
jgi:hypothetical protein